MSDVAAFVLARLAEDEAVAQAASIGSASWSLGEYDETVLWWPPSSPEKVALVRAQYGEELAASHARWAGQTIEVSGDKIAPHIARHDPARVLAQVAALRAVVEEHGNRPPFYVDPCDAHDATGRTVPCDTLRALASIWADHPDYDPAWAMEDA